MSAATKGQVQLLLQNNRPHDARKLCRKLCKHNSKDAEAWFLMGSSYAQTGEYERAAECLERSIALNNRVAVTHTNLGLVHQQTGRLAQARASFENALKLEPDSANALFNLGNVLRLSQHLDEAEAAYRRLLRLLPRSPGVLNNLGITLLEKGEPEAAERCFLDSLEMDPRQSNAPLNLAKACREQRKTEQGLQVLENALAQHTKMPELHWDFALALLELGRFEQGWQEYEWRLKGGTMVRHFPVAGWEGGDISDKTVLVTAEQGIGDEIMFASCYPDLIERAQRVIIDCEPRLAPLFRRSFPRAVIHASRQSDDVQWLGQIPAPDVHISAGSLPLHFRNRLDRFPVHSGYLTADRDTTAQWRQRYDALGNDCTVGISWKGGHVSQAQRRSTSLRDWKAVLEVPGINFINLQYGEVEADIADARECFGVTVHHWKACDPLSDMDGFAAQIAALDLVISVDNSTVHLGGALGIPTWVVQPFCPDWRWMAPSTDSYWYPSVRQFHPDYRGEWKSLLDRVAGELQAHLARIKR